MTSAAWSEPDAQGICTRVLPGRSALEARRLRRRDEVDDTAVSTWPGPWRELAVEWLRGGGESSRWATLLARAGQARTGVAMRLAEDLLSAGWIELEEHRNRNGQWQAKHLRWLHRDRLASRLGLPDAAALRDEAERLHREGFHDERLVALSDSLRGRAPALAQRRLRLLRALDRWLAEGRQGTRREFAHYARDDTKQVSDSEWNWLDEALGLDALSINAHTPGLWLRAPLLLHTQRGALDVSIVPDAIALTPAMLATVTGAGGRIGCWRAVENRTSFEKVAAAYGDVDGVVWLPGFAPVWWREAMATLLRQAPAPLRIACDPDPAGILIALSVAELWTQAGQSWQPWRMDAEDLLSLSARKPLGDYDRAQLPRLAALSLPAEFVRLLDALQAHGKGEQEGLSFEARPAPRRLDSTT